MTACGVVVPRGPSSSSLYAKYQRKTNKQAITSSCVLFIVIILRRDEGSCSSNQCAVTLALLLTTLLCTTTTTTYYYYSILATSLYATLSSLSISDIGYLRCCYAAAARSVRYDMIYILDIGYWI